MRKFTCRDCDYYRIKKDSPFCTNKQKRLKRDDICFGYKPKGLDTMEVLLAGWVAGLW